MFNGLGGWERSSGDVCWCESLAEFGRLGGELLACENYGDMAFERSGAQLMYYNWSLSQDYNLV
jgi:hypothetical protein